MGHNHSSVVFGPSFINITLKIFTIFGIWANSRQCLPTSTGKSKFAILLFFSAFYVIVSSFISARDKTVIITSVCHIKIFHFFIKTLTLDCFLTAFYPNFKMSCSWNGQSLFRIHFYRFILDRAKVLRLGSKVVGSSKQVNFNIRRTK